MKLRNKKTGKIQEIVVMPVIGGYPDETVLVDGETSLKEFNKVWEDYESRDPLIKDEKIRKIVRALFDVWEVEDVKIDSNKYFLVTTIEAIGKGWKIEIPSININGVFNSTELCGEEV